MTWNQILQARADQHAKFLKNYPDYCAYLEALQFQLRVQTRGLFGLYDFDDRKKQDLYRREFDPKKGVELLVKTLSKRAQSFLEN